MKLWQAVAVISLFLTSSGVWAGSEGERVFAKWCIHCHDAGRGNPGTQKLALVRGEDKALLQGRTDLQPAYIKTVVRLGFKEMPSFRPVEISDSQLDELVIYLHANSGN